MRAALSAECYEGNLRILGVEYFHEAEHDKCLALACSCVCHQPTLDDVLATLDDVLATLDAGIEQAAATAGAEWAREASAFLHRYLLAHETMHVDDLWAAGLPACSSPRALGSVFSRAQRDGWMRKTGEYRPSVRSHLTGKPVWRSLLHQPAGAR